jgi:hypothetical protein
MATRRTFDVETDGQRAYLLKFLERQAPPFRAELGPIAKQRTATQNARLWLLHTMAGQHLGYEAEEMHEFALCHHFGFVEKEVVDPMTGELVQKRIPNKRSSTRSREEFRAFMDATETWYGTEFGCWLNADQA